MTDRELLELAAKAAGYPPEWRGQIKVVTDTGERWWNPLTDDGDALRLAVKLRLHLSFDLYAVATPSGTDQDYDEPFRGDPCAAARRAIVRAAAELGLTHPPI